MVGKQFITISFLCSLFVSTIHSVQTTQHGITISSIANDAPGIFMRDKLELPEVDYATKNMRPVLIGIANNSGEPIVVSSNSFGDVALNYQDIARKCFYKNELVSLGFILGGAAIVGANVEWNRREWNSEGSLSYFYYDDLGNNISFMQALRHTYGDSDFILLDDYELLPITKYLGYAGLIATPFYWGYARYCNNAIDAKLKEFVLHQKEVIQPGQKIEKIIFLDSAKLSEKQEIEFDVYIENGIAYFDIKK
jgi:hypothetical protein